MMRFQISAVLISLLILSGCSTSFGPEPDQTGTSSAPDVSQTTAPVLTAKEIAAQVFAGMGDPASIAQSTGVIVDDAGKQWPVHVSVMSVAAGPHSTQLRFILAATSPEEFSVPPSTFNQFSPLTFDIRDVALEQAELGTRLLPFLGVPKGQPDSDQSFCVCSDSPKTLDDQGVVLDATFAPLERQTDTVTVVIPGFEPMENVPVTLSDLN